MTKPKKGDLLLDKTGNIRLVLQDNSGGVRMRVTYLYYNSKEDTLNGTISGGAEKHAVSLYEGSEVIGNLLDIIARCKDG